MEVFQVFDGNKLLYRQTRVLASLYGGRIKNTTSEQTTDYPVIEIRVSGRLLTCFTLDTRVYSTGDTVDTPCLRHAADYEQ